MLLRFHQPYFYKYEVIIFIEMHKLYKSSFVVQQDKRGLIRLHWDEKHGVGKKQPNVRGLAVSARSQPQIENVLVKIVRRDSSMDRSFHLCQNMCFFYIYGFGSVKAEKTQCGEDIYSIHFSCYKSNMVQSLAFSECDKEDF